MTFKTNLLLAGKTATGIVVPEEVVAQLASSKKPPVKVTINGHTYRSSIAVMGGDYMVGVSAENRAAAGVSAGDSIEVDIELDTEPRAVAVPDDLVHALAKNPTAQTLFESLSYSNKLRHVLAIEAAKTPETRQRRVAKAVELFQSGKS
jgi:hypothetical protein